MVLSADICRVDESDTASHTRPIISLPETQVIVTYTDINAGMDFTFGVVSTHTVDITPFFTERYHVIIIHANGDM